MFFIGIHIFCYFGAHAKFQNPSTTSSGRKVTAGESDRRRAVICRRSTVISWWSEVICLKITKIGDQNFVNSNQCVLQCNAEKKKKMLKGSAQPMFCLQCSRAAHTLRSAQRVSKQKCVFIHLYIHLYIHLSVCAINIFILVPIPHNIKGVGI